MKILVTGSSGYLGRQLVRRCVAAGHVVVGVDLRPAGVAIEGPGQFEEHECDVTRQEDVERVVTAARPEAILHCAAALAQFVPDEARMHEVNVTGTRHVLAAAEAAGVARFVFLSSVEVYGIDVPVPCPETAPLAPVCQYGRDKVECEALCATAHERGIAMTILRPPTIAGPGQNEPSLLGQVKAAHRGKSVLLPGGGRTKLQMVNVFDVCDAILLALTTPAASGATLNVASDDVPPLREVVLALYERAGTKPKIRSLSPRWARFIVKVLSKIHLSPIEPQHLEIVLRDYVFDNRRAKEVLGWTPTKTDVESAVDTYDWYVAQNGGP